MAVEATVSQKIRNLGFVCALLVVATHVSWAHDGLGPSWAVWNLVDQGVSRIAVPFFFCVSGYMLAGHFGTAGWFGNEVAKRVRSLLVPFMLYAAWHVIPSRVWPAGLTAMSFPIYVIHVPILRQVSMVLEKVPAVAPCADFVLWTSAVALSIALIVLLRRVLPRVSAGLFAGRV